jgi:hypothetical protein
MRLRIRALERQLLEQGIEPAPSPRASELLMAADALDRCARGELTGLSTIHLQYLAAIVRGLGTWHE